MPHFKTSRWKAGTKHQCPKCKKSKIVSQFKRDDPDGWCLSCRKAYAPAPEPREDDTPVFGARTELELSHEDGIGGKALRGGRVIVVQRMGDVISITTGRRIKRNLDSALVLGGTVLLPIKHLPEVFREVLAASEDGE